MIFYLNVTSGSHKELIELVWTELPKDVLWGEKKKEKKSMYIMLGDNDWY